MDVAIDQGGCIETSKPTTHADPVYIKHDVYITVTNMPDVFPVHLPSLTKLHYRS